MSMITGDYGLTAEAIGRQIGLITGEVTILTGAELDNMDTETLEKIVATNKTHYFSRATPEHKLKIVEAFSPAAYCCSHWRRGK